MEVPTSVELSVGETYTMSLSSLSTAGYVWSYVVEGDADQIDVTTERADCPPPTRGRPLAGSSRDEQFIVLARQPGRVILRLTQRRPWETRQPALKEYTIAITIQPAKA